MNRGQKSTVRAFVERGRKLGLDGDQLADFAIYCISREGNPPKAEAERWVREYLKQEAGRQV